MAHTIYNKKKIIKAQGGFDFSQMASILAGNGGGTANFRDLFRKRQDNIVAEEGGGEFVKQGLSNIKENIMPDALGTVNNAANVASENYWRQQSGRYGTDEVDVNRTGEQIGQGVKMAGQLSGGFLDSELEGVGKMIEGLSTSKTGRGVTDTGIKYNTFNGGARTEKIVGGGLQAAAGGLKALGVPDPVADFLGKTVGGTVGKVAGVAGDNLNLSNENLNNAGSELSKFKFKGALQALTKGSAQEKRLAEESRIMNVETGMKQDEELNKSFLDYATLMPHYDKYSQRRYAKKGGKIISRYSHGGAVILGGQLHKEGNKDLGKGNPIYANGQKVAETEREELLLSKAQTDELESLIGEYDQSKDENIFVRIGQVMKGIIDHQTIDNSGKYLYGGTI